MQYPGSCLLPPSAVCTSSNSSLQEHPHCECISPQEPCLYICLPEEAFGMSCWTNGISTGWVSIARMLRQPRVGHTGCHLQSCPNTLKMASTVLMPHAQVHPGWFMMCAVMSYTCWGHSAFF